MLSFLPDQYQKQLAFNTPKQGEMSIAHQNTWKWPLDVVWSFTLLLWGEGHQPAPILITNRGISLGLSSFTLACFFLTVFLNLNYHICLCSKVFAFLFSCIPFVSFLFHVWLCSWEAALMAPEVFLLSQSQIFFI